MRSRGSGWLGKEAVETSPHCSTWSDQRSRVRKSHFTISAPFDQAGGAMTQLGPERRVDLCGQLPRVFLGLRTKTSSLQGARGSLRPEDGAASLLATHHGSLPSKSLQSFRPIPPQSPFPRSSHDAEQGAGYGVGVGELLVQSSPPPLAPKKHVAGDSLGRARESRSPAPSPVPQFRAGGWFLGARRLHRNLPWQEWLGRAPRGAGLAGGGGLGLGPLVRALPSLGARPRRPRAPLAPVKPPPRRFASCFRPVGTSPNCPTFIFSPPL